MLLINRPRVQNRRQRSRKNQINNKRILISNSQNIEISNDDIDLISNIEVLFQVLETLLMQLDIV
ncbi:spore coat protein [Priestia megaterium]